jgi:hypothetical protein
MIKIISAQKFPNDTVIAAVKLCNEFNKNGQECILYGLDNWHIDKCKSEPISSFKIKDNDTIIVFDYPIYSYDDFFNLNKKIRNLYELKKVRFFRKIKLLFKNKLRKFRNYIRGCVYRKLRNVKFIFNVQTIDNIDVLKVSKFYDKINFIGEEYLDKSISKYFIAPNHHDKVIFVDNKLSKNAAIIGDIYAGNDIEYSIDKAIKDGMEKIMIYGFMRDPIYFYKKIEPLFKEYANKLEMAGFSDDYQKILSSVSDVYLFPKNKVISNVVNYCQMANVKLHCNENVIAAKNLDEAVIFKIWKKELNL